MAPENPHKLVVLDLGDETDRLVASRYRIDFKERFLVKWYPVATPPADFQALAGGVIYVPRAVTVPPPELDVEIPSAKGFYEYKDWTEMLVLILPEKTTLAFRDPKPAHAKVFQRRVAVYWLAPKSSDQMEASWSLPATAKDSRVVAQEIEDFLAESRSDVPAYSVDDYAHYDFALSYASEDRQYVEQIAGALLKGKTRVFFDHHDRPRLLGRDLDRELDAIFSKRSTFCVVFVSKHYAEKEWTRKELTAALTNHSRDDHIIPIQLDDTKLEQLAPNIAYAPAETPVSEVCRNLLEKLRRG